jgi:radical SAM protein with 4Fe4S-binding SPASM domain
MTVTRRNERDLCGMLDHAGRVGVDRFHVSHLVYTGRAPGVAADDLSPADARRLLLQLFDRVGEAESPRPRVVADGNDSGGALLVRWVGGRFGAAAGERVLGVLSRRGGNAEGEATLSIDHRGRVHPDEFWQSAELGDLRQQSFAEILAHPLRAELKQRAQRLGGRCGSCRFVDLCRGSHRERALARTRDLWAPDPACVMTDEEVGVVRFAAGAVG